MAEEAVYRVCANRHLSTLYNENLLATRSEFVNFLCVTILSRHDDKRRIKTFFNAGARKRRFSTSIELNIKALTKNLLTQV